MADRFDEEERRRWDEELRRRHEHERQLAWKRYNSPARRRLAEQYHRARGDADLLEGGTPIPPHPYDPDDQ